MNKNRIIFGLLALVVCMHVRAQAISVPYSMSFEESDSVEMQQWELNPGAKGSLCADQWVVGTATHSSGKRALYISADGGESACFDSTQNVQYAYRDIILPKANYELSFDWRCMGSDVACLYAGVAPKSNVEKDMMANNLTGSVPSTILPWCKTLGPLRGNSAWKNESLPISSNGTNTLRIFFVWASSNKDTKLAVPLGGCIDNIQICSADCPKPHDLAAVATCDSVWVSWKGASEIYCLEYRKRGKDKWTVFSGIKQESKVLEGLEEGLYDLRVRGVCNQKDTSAYAYLNSFAIFCPEKHCINYVNLYDSTNVICTYGTYNAPYTNQGVIDYGADDKYSRHTVNWEPDIFDPRTCGQLPTIPDGELASVRLGNWNNGGEGESVSFLYTADLENAAILLLKYAVVLEDPDHGPTAQPRFQLSILNEAGELISPTCGFADFYADSKRQDAGWHSCGKAPGASSAVSWKEWTTIGLNLQEAGVQDGEQLTIQLTTLDCAWSAHFGYAYFTLGCANAKLQGTSCGNEAKLKVAAPNGFNYAWYNKYDSLVATTQELSVDPSDTTTYRCTLTYQENEECSFDLYAAARPRFPIADFKYQYAPTNCENRVIFINKSHIMTMFDGDTVHHYDEPCDSYEWTYGTGDEGAEKNPVYVFPQKGGHFPVTLFASISEGYCIEDTTIWIDIPAIGDTLIHRDTTLCDGSFIIFGKQYIGQSGMYRDTLKSMAGCDSILEITIIVYPQSKGEMRDTTICAGQLLIVEGQQFMHTKSAPFPIFSKNQYGCDSTWGFNVMVRDSILPVVVMKDVEGSKQNTGEFTISGSGYQRFTMTHDNQTTEYTDTEVHITGLNGGLFVFEFFNELNCSVLREEQMTYPCKNLIFQRWNDVLSVLNSDSIGGMQFTQFQWLKNDVAIPEATLSFYYATEGLDMNAHYSVSVTTTNGATFTSCPWQPIENESPAQSVARKRIENQRLVIQINNAQYNAQGIKIRNDELMK